MITALNPKYYIYFVDNYNMKGLMEFKEKKEMNLWLLVHGKNCEYMKIMSGFTLDERRSKDD
jgi:hypothetical protein